ncbi:MAG TPA: sulfite exporter TauE/SafE family protein, partial [Burkholderiaceae bacterium]|nr:sulfite exporter TauE/SafE family protein [Burkholderiaceae bacterium]
MTAIFIAELIALGIFSGFLAGLLGIGGGMVMVPILTFMMSGTVADPGVAVKVAIATSMGVIVFTSASSVRAHHKRGAVRWDIVRKLAPGIILGSFIGSMGIFALLKGKYLAIFFGVFVAFSATQMFLNKKPKPSRDMPGTAGQLVAGGF